jgi:GNAT superfamily N-acetyltransferase
LLGLALVQSLAVKFKAEGLADSVLTDEVHVPGFELLRYRAPRHWPGPPAFDFSLEFLAQSDVVPAAVERAVRSLAPPDEALVVRTYEPTPPEDPEVGFMPLIERSIEGGDAIQTSWARRIVSAADLDFVNRTHVGADAIRPGVLSDPRVRTFFVEEDGQAVASGAVVIAGREGGKHKVAYIADMVTMPKFRGRGWGKKVLRTLLSEAREAGCERAILLPSPFALKSRFYERGGFRPAGGLRVNYFLPRALSSILVVDRPST